MGEPSHRLRAMRLLQAQVATVPALGGRVWLGWRSWLDIALERFPCAFVDVDELGGPLTEEGSETIVGDQLFSVFVYAQPQGPFATEDEAMEAATVVREELVKPVAEAILSAAMVQAVQADLVAHGEVGVTRFSIPGFPATDAGLNVGYGLFRMHVRARVHLTTTGW